MKDPFAMFRYRGEVVEMNRDQFHRALRDARLCRCGNCLACRAAVYDTEAREARESTQPKRTKR